MKNPSLAKLVLSKWLDFSLRLIGTRPISSHLDLVLDLSITQIIDLEHEAFEPIFIAVLWFANYKKRTVYVQKLGHHIYRIFS